MATSNQQAVGIVNSAKGEVFAREEDGKMRRLNVGDQIFEHDVIVTANGSAVDISMFNAPALSVGEQQTIAVDAQVTAVAPDETAGAVAPLGSTEAAKVIQTVATGSGLDVNALLAEDAAAAGLTGGDGADGGHTFVDLMRIVENVPGANYDFPLYGPGAAPIIQGQLIPQTATEAPTQAPTEAPTQAPTETPTQVPTQAPTEAPTEAPTQAPTEAPTEAPTQAPTEPPPTEPPPTEPPPTETPPELSGAASQVEESSLDGSKTQSPGTNEIGTNDVVSGTIPFVPGSSGLDRLIINGQDLTDGGVVNGQYGRLTVVHNEDGSYGYKYELSANVYHPIPEESGGTDGSYADDTLPDNFQMQVVNSGVVRATAPLTITITDDGPTVTTTESELDVLVQSDAGLKFGNGERQQADSGEFSTAFKVVFGADGGHITSVEGESVTDGMRYGFSFEEGASTGLKDTATGSDIKLYTNEETGLVEARAENGKVIFTLSIDDTNGVVTLTQVRAIQHAAPDGEESNLDELQALASGAISVVATATDGDLDTAKSSVDLGGLVQFGDDEPVVNLSRIQPSALVQTDAGLKAGNGPDQVADTESFGKTFSVSFGADGAKLSLVNGKLVEDGKQYGFDLIQGASTGLKDTATGSDIKLYTNDNGVVEARAGSEQGAVIFTLSIVEKTGAVTLTQVGAIQHAAPDGKPGGLDELQSLASGAIRVVAMATDGDLDTAKNSVDLGGLLKFGDDVPIVGVNASTGNLLPGFTVSYQGGEAGYNNSFGYYVMDSAGRPVSGVVLWDNVKDGGSVGLSLPTGVAPENVGFFIIPNGDSVNQGLSDNARVTFSQLQNGQWVAKVGNSVLSGDGANVYFSDQALNVDGQSHVQNAPSGTEKWLGNFNWEDLKITATSSDKDYDDINLQLKWNGVPLLVKDSEADAGVSTDTDSGAGETALSTRFSFNFGADGAAADNAKLFGLSVRNGVDSGLDDTATGQSVAVKLVDGMAVGYVTIDGVQTQVFSVQVNSTTGVVTVTQDRAVMHDSNNPHEITNLASGVIRLTATATDGDKDVATNLFDISKAINFQDSGPVAVDDKLTLNLADGIKVEGDLLANDSYEGKADGASAEIVWNRAGGDRTYNTTDFTDNPTLDATGQLGKLVIEADGDAAYTLTSEGAFTAKALAEGATLTETFNYQMKDADTDTDVANVNVKVIGVNDAPEFVTGKDKTTTIELGGKTSTYSEANQDSIQLRVVEDALKTGNRDARDDSTTDKDGFGVADPDIGDNVVVKFATDSDGKLLDAPALTSGGEKVVWSLNSDGTQAIGSADGQQVITVQLSGSQQNGYESKVELLGAIDHLPTVQGDGDGDVANLQFAVIANDRPLNPSTGLQDSLALTVQVEDDAGVANGAQNLVIANAGASFETVPQVTNLVLTLDTSSSMSGDKLAALKSAMLNVIDQYEDSGGVHVQFTAFNQDAQTSAWMSAADAKAAIQNLSTSDWTNYEAAIRSTVLGDGPDSGNLTDSAPISNQTVAYFVTDGAPTMEINSGNDVKNNVGTDAESGWVDSTYTTSWQNFINAQVDHLFVVAVQTPTTDPDLLELAAVDPKGDGTVKIVEVKNTGDMVNLLEETVVEGEVIPVSGTASLGIDIGADGWGTAAITEVSTLAEPTAVRYVTALAANGDSIIATSGGTKLVYEDDGQGGLRALKEGSTTDVVFTLTLNKDAEGAPLGTYSYTLLDVIDAYKVTTVVDSDPVVDKTTGDSVTKGSYTTTVSQTVTKTVSDSVTFTNDSKGGGTGEELIISQTDNTANASGNISGITFQIKATGTSSDGSSGAVNWSTNGIGVDNNFIDNPKPSQGTDLPSEQLKLAVSASSLPAGTSNVNITKITVTADHLDKDEKAIWDVAGGSDNDSSKSGLTDKDNTSNDTPIAVTLGTSDTVTFTSSNADGYRIDLEKGLTVDYTYTQTTTVEVPKTYETKIVTDVTTTTETVTTTTTAYDVTLVFNLNATDGDGDAVNTTFHVTVDANNDGVMNAVSSGEVVGVVSETVDKTVTTDTVVTTTYVNDSQTEVLLSNKETHTEVEKDPVTTSSSVTESASDLEEALSTLAPDATDQDVMVAGDLQDYKLDGGTGDDVITLGDGNDLIVINLADQTKTETDTLVDFNPAKDSLVVGDVIESKDAAVVIDIASDGKTVTATPETGAVQEIVTMETTVATAIDASLTEQIKNP